MASVQRVLSIVGNAITEYVAVQTGSGAASAGQLVALNANGVVDATLIDLSKLSTATLPTTLPATAGVLWNNGGVLSIS